MSAGLSLAEDDLDRLVAWRHALHRRPELSGEECETARAVADFLASTVPDQLVTGLGGHGVAAVYAGAAPGPTLLLRCELDALPIPETSGVAHASQIEGKGHLCGHDGHMATLAGVALALARRRPAHGRAVLMFQPAEETGAGAAAVIADPRFAAIAPDLSLAWHNLPGLPPGAAALVEGPVACASQGLRITLTGHTSHAAEPETALSPMPALLRLAPALAALGEGGVLRPDFRLVTITHLRLGEPTYGVTPGLAELRATLRTMTDAGMAALRAEAVALARREAQAAGLAVAFENADVFAHVENHPDAVAVLARALEACGVPRTARGVPMRASEDFGLFGRARPAAMLFVGSGENHPRLHHPDYDFPDALIGHVAPILLSAVRDVLG